MVDDTTLDCFTVDDAADPNLTDDDEIGFERRAVASSVAMAGAIALRSTNSSPSSEGDPTPPSDAYKYQRRRSRAVLYQLSGTYDKQMNSKSKIQLNKVADQSRISFNNKWVIIR